MKTEQWKIRKTARVCASAAGGAACNSLPSWENHMAPSPTAGPTGGLARHIADDPTVGRTSVANCQPCNGATRPTSCELRKLAAKQLLTGKVIGRYNAVNHWLVLSL